ncbi:MAG: hypothetical protein KJ630_07700 [Proteobacteria bacterium]|nr:hypothetical protein [Pseudomonadota bacterium]
MVFLATAGIVMLSLVITSVALAIFQGYVDLLGIVICVAAPLLIFPLPARIFFTTYLKLYRTEEDLRIKNCELEQALREVKTLSGLLPICCSCKKIRDDQGYWSEVEDYFCDRMDLQLTHGFCPECVARLYPGLQSAASPPGPRPC